MVVLLCTDEEMGTEWMASNENDLKGVGSHFSKHNHKERGKRAKENGCCPYLREASYLA